MLADAAIAPMVGAAGRTAATRVSAPRRVAPAPVQPVLPQLPDWQADPVLQRIEAQQQAAVAQAQAQALANRQQAEIQFGYDPNYAYADETTRQAAQQNPFSTLTQLLQGHQRADTNIDEGYNKQNLFYSGHRAKALGDEAQNYLQQQYNATQGLRNQLSGITSNLLAAQTGSANAVSQGESDAYNRGLNFQLSYGGYPQTSQVSQPQPYARVAAPRGLPKARAAGILARQLPMRY